MMLPVPDADVVADRLQEHGEGREAGLDLAVVV